MAYPRARPRSASADNHDITIISSVTRYFRYLLPGENVHHRNGVKDDNRPENLELWTRPQPAGIRASDAVAWARAILARYEGETQPLSGPSADVY